MIAFQVFQYLSRHYGCIPVGDVLGDPLGRQASLDCVLHSQKSVDKCIDGMGGSECDAAVVLVGLNETWERRQDKSSAARQGFHNNEWRPLAVSGAKEACVTISNRVSQLLHIQQSRANKNRSQTDRDLASSAPKYRNSKRPLNRWLAVSMMLCSPGCSEEQRCLPRMVPVRRVQNQPIIGSTISRACCYRSLRMLFRLWGAIIAACPH
jgi:hypothetical protein